MKPWMLGAAASPLRTPDSIQGPEAKFSTSLSSQYFHGGNVIDLKKLVREIPDYPKPGILFYDITTLLKDPLGLHWAVDALANTFLAQKVDRVVGIEARGFIFAPMVAYRLNAGFVPVRKPNKLPAERATMSYSLEYGKDSVEIHRDAIAPGQDVVIIGFVGYRRHRCRHRALGGVTRRTSNWHGIRD
jgi:hypothetical protein